MSENDNPPRPTIDYASPEQNKRPQTSSIALILLTLVLLAFVASIFIRPIGRSRESANRMLCASHLRQIGQAILLYTNEHNGQYPDSFSTLITTQYATTKIFTCPSCNDLPAAGPTTQAIAANLTAGGHLSYIYLGRGWTVSTIPANAVVAYEPLTNHDGEGMNVLFGDGHVEFLTPTQAQPILANAAPGKPPVTIPSQ